MIVKKGKIVYEYTLIPLIIMYISKGNAYIATTSLD